MYKVAPSFTDYIQEGEPFSENAKKYIYAINPRTNNKRKIRLYTEQEFYKLYPHLKETGFQNLKETLGFTKGYITILRAPSNLDSWLSSSIARYHRIFGWYIPSFCETPTLPYGIQSYTLKWEDAGLPDGRNLKTEEQIKTAIDKLIYGEESTGEYVGDIGDRITFSATLLLSFVSASQWGDRYTYVFEDKSNGNRFSWKTSQKSIIENETYTITATIKEQKIIKGKKVNIVTRGSFVKK